MELRGNHLEARGERTDDHGQRQNRENQGGEAGESVGVDGHGLDPFFVRRGCSRPVNRDIGPSFGECPLPLRHEGFLRNFRPSISITLV